MHEPSRAARSWVDDYDLDDLVKRTIRGDPSHLGASTGRAGGQQANGHSGAAGLVKANGSHRANGNGKSSVLLDEELSLGQGVDRDLDRPIAGYWSHDRRGDQGSSTEKPSASLDWFFWSLFGIALGFGAFIGRLLAV